jgi:pyruvate kinase
MRFVTFTNIGLVEGPLLTSEPKILATIGPASSSYEVIYELIKHGVSGFRINFAFGNPDTWRTYVKLVREASEGIGSVVSIIGDIPGPQIRTSVQEPFNVSRGEFVALALVGTQPPISGVKTIYVDRSELFEMLKPGDVVFYGDGEVELRVVESNTNYAKCIVTSPGFVRSGKKLAVQGKELPTSFLTPQDLELIKFACSENLTYIALSYVRDHRDVLLVKDILHRLNFDMGIISKIETPSGVSNVEKIVEVSDAILVARGDLGVHFPLEQIPILQDRIINISIVRRKPVIVATDILESMIENPRPSRSDVVGIYNIIYSLADALLLTNETAIGRHPVDVVKWARAIVNAAASHYREASNISDLRKKLPCESLIEKYIHGVVQLAESLDAKIIAYTKTGRIIPLISSERPRVPVYVGTFNKRIAERATIFYGICPLDLSKNLTELDDYEKGVEEVYKLLRRANAIRIGDIVLKSYSKRGADLYEIRVEVVT